MLALPKPVHDHGRRLLAAVLAVLMLGVLNTSSTMAASTTRAAHGVLEVSSQPQLPTTIYVDGSPRNTTRIDGLELPVGDHQLSFSSVEGYLPPQPQTVTIEEGSTTDIVGEFVPAGVLEVTTSPADLEPIIAIDGIERDRGTTTIAVATGDTEICVADIPGHVTPDCQTVSIEHEQAQSVEMIYELEAAPGNPADPASKRVTDGLITLYDFSAGQGDAIDDLVGVNDLRIASTSAVTWTTNGLRFNAPTIARTSTAPAELYRAVQASDEFTFEAWVTPSSKTQNGPARIFSLGRDTTAHNLIVGQGAHEGPSELIEARVGRDTKDRTRTPEGSFGEGLTHLVASYSADGTLKVYLDGELASTTKVSMPVDKWNTSYRLGLGAELNGDRPWLGTYHLAALYDTALDASDVAVNYEAGTDVGSITPPVEPAPDVTPPVDPAPSPKPSDPDEAVPASWNTAWESRNYNSLRNWYRQNTGIAAAGLKDSDLTPSGSVASSRDGQTIEGLLVNGGITIRHDNVTVRNTKVVGSSIGINVPYVARSNVNHFTVENVSIIGTEPTALAAAEQGIGATYARVTAKRVYVSNRRGGLRLSNNGGDVVEGSMVENIRHVAPAHNTGVSYRGGAGVRLTRNWIEGSTSAALSLYPDSKPITDLVARENLFDGGTYSVRGGTDKVYRDELRDIKFLDNRFTRDHQYGARAAWCGSCPGNEWRGNNYLTDGAEAK